MYSLQINSSPTYVAPLFKACSPSLTAIQRKVVSIALIIFSCLVACYACFQIYFKANEQRIKPLNHEESFQILKSQRFLCRKKKKKTSRMM